MKHGRMESLKLFHVAMLLLGITVATNGMPPLASEDYNDVQMQEEFVNWLNHENSTRTPTTKMALTTPTTPAPPIDYNSFMERVNGPLSDEDFEYMLDYYNNKSSIAFALLHDFNSANISRMLIDRATLWHTTPVQFLEEMTDLISLEKEQRSNAKGIYGADPEKRLSFLKKKYNISAECVVSDCVSISRIAFVFPHLGLIGEKPISVRQEIKKVTGSTSDQVIVVEPNILRNPLFGGIIPMPHSQSPSQDYLRMLVTVHLYHSQEVLYGNETVPMRLQGIMLYRRMKKSLLSDVRKTRLLQLYDVLGGSTSYYYYIRAGVQAAFDHISADFKNSVPVWLYSDHIRGPY